MTTLSVFIPGTPVPQGSMRAFVVGKRAILTSANKKTMPWRDTVNAYVHNAMCSENLLCRSGPVTMDMVFYFPRTPSHYGTGKNLKILKASSPREKTSKPDTDKLVRAVLDALTWVAYQDDAQVVSLSASKMYVPESPIAGPGLSLRIDWRTA